jgi:hypothetical protein
MGLTAEDAGGFARLMWTCESGVARYDLLRRVGGSGPFTGVGFTIYPTVRQAGAAPTCAKDDTEVPRGNNVEYIVIGFSSRLQGERAISGARTMVFIR